MTPSEILRDRDSKIKKLTNDLVKDIKALEVSVFNEIQKSVLDKISTTDGEVKRTKGNLAKLSTLKSIERRTRKDKAKLVKKALKGMREQIALAAEYYREITGKSRLSENQTVKEFFNAKMGINDRGMVTRGPLFNLVNNGDEFRSIQNAVQSGVMSRAPVGAFKETAQNAFTSSPNSFANTLSSTLRTTFAENEREVDKQYADELDFQFYQYTGGLVNLTRDFCEEKVGKVFHESEIYAWAAQSWKGKSNPYDPFVDVGGYNCLHTLRPITVEMARLRGKDVDRFI